MSSQDVLDVFVPLSCPLDQRTRTRVTGFQPGFGIDNPVDLYGTKLAHADGSEVADLPVWSGSKLDPDDPQLHTRCDLALLGCKLDSFARQIGGNIAVVIYLD